MKGATGTEVPLSDPTGVSIHAPNEGSDLYFCVGFLTNGVSIHAPNEGSDLIADTPVRS